MNATLPPRRERFLGRAREAYGIALYEHIVEALRAVIGLQVNAAGHITTRPVSNGIPYYVMARATNRTDAIAAYARTVHRVVGDVGTVRAIGSTVVSEKHHPIAHEVREGIAIDSEVRPTPESYRVILLVKGRAS